MKETTLNVNVRIKWEVVPAHDGTTDETIPERVNITSVVITEGNHEIEISQALSADTIEMLEAEAMQENQF